MHVSAVNEMERMVERESVCQGFGVAMMWSFASMCQETATDNSVMVYMTSSSVSCLCVSKLLYQFFLVLVMTGCA